MKTTALKVFFSIYLLNLHQSSNGDYTSNRTNVTNRKIRSLESFFKRKVSEIKNVSDYRALYTLSDIMNNYLEFPLLILKKTGEEIVNKLGKIIHDTFGDHEDAKNALDKNILVLPSDITRMVVDGNGDQTTDTANLIRRRKIRRDGPLSW